MDFDPYYKWLAIPPTEQPPNHYRLLGVPLFTSDPDVLENAADQRMAHLRSFQTGRYSQESQRLLNEVAAARICLLNESKRAEYDARLRRELPVAMPAPQAAPRPVLAKAILVSPPPSHLSPPPLASPPVATESPLPRIQSRPTKRKKPHSPIIDVIKQLSASVTGLFGGYLILGFISPNWDHFHLFHRAPVIETKQREPIAKPDQVKPVVNPPAVPAKQFVTENPTSKQTEPTTVPPRDKPQLPTVPLPQPTAEELAEKAAAEQQQRLEQLKADCDAAIAAGKITQAFKLSAEFAQLSGLDPREEKLRVINELRKTDHPPAETFILTGAMLAQARDALANNQKPLATEHATVALQLARKTTDQDLIRQATKMILEIQQQE